MLAIADLAFLIDGKKTMLIFEAFVLLWLTYRTF